MGTLCRGEARLWLLAGSSHTRPLKDPPGANLNQKGNYVPQLCPLRALKWARKTRGTMFAPLSTEWVIQPPYLSVSGPKEEHSRALSHPAQLNAFARGPGFVSELLFHNGFVYISDLLLLITFCAP